MTPREQALTAYFYQVATDPRVRAAGLSPAKLRDAVLACVAEDVPSVMRYALGGALAAAEPQVARATRSATETVLGGTVSDRATGEIAQAVETLVRDGFRRVGRAIAEKKR